MQSLQVITGRGLKIKRITVFLESYKSQQPVTGEQPVNISMGRKVNSLPTAPYRRLLPKLFMLLKRLRQAVDFMLSVCHRTTSGNVLCCKVAELPGRMAFTNEFSLICYLVTQLILSCNCPDTLVGFILWPTCGFESSLQLFHPRTGKVSNLILQQCIFLSHVLFLRKAPNSWHNLPFVCLTPFAGPTFSGLCMFLNNPNQWRSQLNIVENDRVHLDQEFCKSRQSRAGGKEQLMGTFGGSKLAVFLQNNTILQYSASITVQLM